MENLQLEEYTHQKIAFKILTILFFTTVLHRVTRSKTRSSKQCNSVKLRTTPWFKKISTLNLPVKGC